MIARPFAGRARRLRRGPPTVTTSRSCRPPTRSWTRSAEAGLEVRGVGQDQRHLRRPGSHLARGPPARTTTASTASSRRCRRLDRGSSSPTSSTSTSPSVTATTRRGTRGPSRQFDRRLPEIAAALRTDDVLIITADHGNDPTTPSTDHSRERVPVLGRPGSGVGTRDPTSGVGATFAELRMPTASAEPSSA